ncbi:MAG: hypothetical protein LQ349_006188 [Xanthoria aureola]|nr:MAG: hypothetical protein LQ349_006188 [Xanthoria aureola]
MPPQRSIPPSKAIKTERTHEENQERAYIAASRRSDRSLEARVESARRASEIHKRRTGRSLRVTEQDVVNEEMYEEEDDDLPMQYRRLTAHLQTGSADFNRRLSAYLTNHVAMRSALDQAITNSYAQQYPNAPQFAHNQAPMYPSPFMHQGMTPAQSPQSYMQSPYSSASTANFRPSSARPIPTPSHHSPTSYGQSPPTTSSPADVPDQRRSSMQSKSASPVAVRTPQSMHARPSLPLLTTSGQPPPESTSSQTPVSMQPHQVPPTPTSLYSPQELGPFTTSLPPESQMLLGSALDVKDPMNSILMGGNDGFGQSYWASGFGASSKPRNFHPSFDGMSATLAPSALDMSSQPTSHNLFQPLSSMPTTNPPFMSFDSNMPEYSKGFYHYNNGPSPHGSGTATPGALDGGWDAFINDNSWAENTS